MMRCELKINVNSVHMIIHCKYSQYVMLKQYSYQPLFIYINHTYIHIHNGTGGQMSRRDSDQPVFNNRIGKQNISPCADAIYVCTYSFTFTQLLLTKKDILLTFATIIKKSTLATNVTFASINKHEYSINKHEHRQNLQ